MKASLFAMVKSPTAEANLLSSILTRLRAHSPVRLTSEVSVGMAAHGNAKTTRQALEALFAAAHGDFELILVDDRSPDEILEVYREAAGRHANTRIFSFASNLEYCHSVNAFLSHSRGERLLFLSNDVFINPSYLRALLHAADRQPACGILRGCSNFVDNDSPAHNVATPPLPTRRARFAFAAAIATRHASMPPADERYLVGDAFLVTRALLQRIGTFDTRFVGYCADLDFGLRAQIAGYRVVLVPAAFAVHEENVNITYLPAQARELKIALRMARAAEALRLFLEKYRLPAQAANVNQLPWETLVRQPFDPALHHVAPGDYSRYLVSGPGATISS
jgi:GT2 family glycosyltransferase